MGTIRSFRIPFSKGFRSNYGEGGIRLPGLDILSRPSWPPRSLARTVLVRFRPFGRVNAALLVIALHISNPNFHGIQKSLRRGRDSSPRYRYRYNSLAGSPIQPLSHLSNENVLTEKVGFEPTEPLGSTVFKTASFNHSDTSPYCYLSMF